MLRQKTNNRLYIFLKYFYNLTETISLKENSKQWTTAETIQIQLKIFNKSTITPF